MAAMNIEASSLGEPASEKGRITWAVHNSPTEKIDHTSLQSIGEVAKRFGLTLRALRFYEAKGLLRPLRDGNIRYYGPKDTVRIELVIKGKLLGFTLTEIISMLGDERHGTAPDLILNKKQTLAQITHLEARHREIERALVELRRRYYMMADLAEKACPAPL